MNRDETVRCLSNHLAEIRSRFAVDNLALFGSLARDEAGPDSDADVLVTYRQSPGFFDFLELKMYLEKMLQRPVDLVTEKALKKQLRDQIAREVVRVS